MTISSAVVVVRSAQCFQPCADRFILPNNNAVRDCLLDASRCFVARRDLLFVVRSLRGGAHCICAADHKATLPPKKHAHARWPEAFLELCEI